MRAASDVLAKAGRVRLFVLVSSYAFGAVMLGHELLSGFVYLTAPHLCLTAALLLSAHEDRRPQSLARNRLLLWAVTCGLLGWWAEFVGVHYGFLFGDYAYGEVLGPAWQGIPLVMAVNWILVVYAACVTVQRFAGGWRPVGKTAVAAVVLVLLDLLIEPVAIRLGFWRWAGGTPPLNNYLGWLAVGAVQAGLFYALLPVTVNRLAPLVLALQVLFFAYLSIVLL